MKKLYVIVAIFGICAVLFGKDAFLGWNCTDVAKMNEQLAKSDADVRIIYKYAYVYAIAKIETPDAVSTFDKTMAFFKTKFPTANEKFIFQRIVQIKFRRTETDFNDDILKSKYAVDDEYVDAYYKVIGAKRMNISTTPEEQKTIIIEKYPIYVSKGSFQTASYLLDCYIKLSLNDDDATVIQNLKMFYRITLVEVPKNDKWKPVIVKISLALKSRGEDVK